MNKSQLYYYDLVEKQVNLKGGILKSKFYVNNRTPMDIICDKGHEISMTWKSLFKGHWCKICGSNSSGTKRKKDITIIQEFVANKGGKLLSTEYKNAHIHLLWKCHNENHPPFLMKWNNVRNGYWCDPCGVERTIEKLKLDISVLQDEAIKRGGRLISTEYKNSHTAVKWQCKNKHEFSQSWNTVLQGHWCPICKKSIGERMVSEVLKELNIIYDRQVRFPNVTRYSYDFHFMLGDKHVLIEFDGKQHFAIRPFLTKDEETFEYRRTIDKVKTYLAVYTNCMLIRLDYKQKSRKKIKYHIINAIQQNNNLYLSDPNMYDWLLNGEIPLDFIEKYTPLFYDALLCH